MRVTLHPSQNSFECNAEETLLAAGLRANIILPHACKNGFCGACKCRVITGTVHTDSYSPSALSEEELQNGHTLLCRARADNDIELALGQPSPPRHIDPKIFPARVHSISKPATDIAVINLRIPRNEDFDFIPGQYIDIILPDNKYRSYSIASFDPVNRLIELHVRKIAGGLFSAQIHDSLKDGDMLRFRGPQGGFILEDSCRPVILAATGTGFAPIKAMLSALQLQTPSRTVHFYWGNRIKSDLYAGAELTNLAQRESWFRFTPILSRTDGRETWPGATGHIQEAVKHDYPNLSEFEAYACGSPNMITDLRTTLLSIGLAPEHFHADPFYAPSR